MGEERDRLRRGSEEHHRRQRRNTAPARSRPVLRYRQRMLELGHDRVVAVLVPERQPSDPSWRKLFQDLGVVLLCGNESERAPALDMP
jgi:hypothetical protein